MATKIGKRSSGQRPISLALQGGGMHGAFTWSVLDPAGLKLKASAQAR